MSIVGRSGKKVTPITPIKPEEAQRSGNQFSGAVEAHKLFNDYEIGTKLTEKATGWIKERGDKPFFCYFSTTNVHHPFTPAKRFQGTSECGVYGDFVHELDWIVGEVMKTLEEQGVADNTLVLFTSDNGGMFNLGGRAAAEKGHKINGDLLGSKFGIWEGGHRVPFIARWPGKIEAGSVSEQLLISADLHRHLLRTHRTRAEESKGQHQHAPRAHRKPGGAAAHERCSSHRTSRPTWRCGRANGCTSRPRTTAASGVRSPANTPGVAPPSPSSSAPPTATSTSRPAPSKKTSRRPSSTTSSPTPTRPRTSTATTPPWCASSVRS